MTRRLGPVAGGLLSAVLTLGVLAFNGTAYAQTNVDIMADPATVTEGAGVVEVRVWAVADSAVSGALDVTLGDSPDSTELSIARHFTAQGQLNSVPGAGSPTLTIADGQTTSNEEFIRLRVPLGDANEAQETITIPVATFSQTGYTSSGLTFTIPTTQPGVGETRFGQKRIRYNNRWDFDDAPGATQTIVSSRAYFVDGTNYNLVTVNRPAGVGMIITVSAELPTADLVWRFIYDDGTTVDLPVSAAQAQNVTGPNGFRYRWGPGTTFGSYSGTLPTFSANEWFSLELLREVEDNTPPQISTLQITNPTSGWLGLGEDITVTVMFDEDVTVSAGAAIAITLASGNQGATLSGDGSLARSHTFTHTVEATDEDANGVSIAANSFTGTITDEAGNAVTDPGHQLVGQTGNPNVDGAVPTVSSATFNSPASGDTFNVDTPETIEVTVTFSEDVTVTVTGNLADNSFFVPIQIGTEERMANYDATATTAARTAASSQDLVVFSYTLQAGGSDDNGIEVLASKSITVPGNVTIRDPAGNDATLDLPTVPADSMKKVGTAVAASNDITVGFKETTYSLEEGHAVDAANGVVITYSRRLDADEIGSGRDRSYINVFVERTGGAVLQDYQSTNTAIFNTPSGDLEGEEPANTESFDFLPSAGVLEEVLPIQMSTDTQTESGEGLVITLVFALADTSHDAHHDFAGTHLFGDDDFVPGTNNYRTTITITDLAIELVSVDLPASIAAVAEGENIAFELTLGRVLTAAESATLALNGIVLDISGTGGAITRQGQGGLDIGNLAAATGESHSINIRSNSHIVDVVEIAADTITVGLVLPIQADRLLEAGEGLTLSLVTGDALWASGLFEAGSTTSATVSITESTAIADQQWYRDEAVEVVMPRFPDDASATYAITPALPMAITLVRNAGEVPMGVDAPDTYPALVGAPTAEFTTAEFTYTATPTSGSATELDFDISVATLPPTNLRVTPLVDGFRLDWNPPQTADSSFAISGYQVEWYTNESGNVDWPASPQVPNQSTTTYTHTGFPTEDRGLLTVTYRVSAISAGGTSQPTAPVTSPTLTNNVPPAAVDTLTATATTETSVTLGWTAPDARGGTISGFNVQRTETAPGAGTRTWTLLTSSPLGADATSYTDSGLTSGTTYYYQVAATSDGGTAGWSADLIVTTSEPSGPATVTITATPASVNEGEGTVDVRVVATVPAGSEPSSALTATLSDVATGDAADLDLLGYFSNQGQQDSAIVTDLTTSPPVLTIPGTARQSNELFLRFSVPLGDENEPVETITLTATLGDTTNFTTSGLDIMIPTTQPAAGETRIAQKAVLLSIESGSSMGWDIDGNLPGTLSSRDFVIDSQTYSLTSIDGRTDDSRLQINVSGQFPDDQNKLLRIITSADSGDLRISDANFAGASGSSYVYQWTSNLPEIIEEEYFTMELVHVEPPAAVPVTLNVQSPTSLTEGGGIVDVVLTASVTSSVGDTAVVVSGLATTSDDVSIVGDAPTLTIPVNGTESPRAVLRLMVPVDPDTGSETAQFTATTDNTAGFTVTPLDIAVGDSTLAAYQTRLAQKQLQLRQSGTHRLWGTGGPAGPISYISSTVLPTELRDGSGNNDLFEMGWPGPEGSNDRHIIAFTHRLPDSVRDSLLVRIAVDGGASTDLNFSDTDYRHAQGSSGNRHRYWWNSGAPTIPVDTWITLSLIESASPNVTFAAATDMVTEGTPKAININVSPGLTERANLYVRLSGSFDATFQEDGSPFDHIGEVMEAALDDTEGSGATATRLLTVPVWPGMTEVPLTLDAKEDKFWGESVTEVTLTILNAGDHLLPTGYSFGDHQAVTVTITDDTDEPELELQFERSEVAEAAVSNDADATNTLRVVKTNESVFAGTWDFTISLAGGATRASTATPNAAADDYTTVPHDDDLMVSLAGNATQSDAINIRVLNETPDADGGANEMVDATATVPTSGGNPVPGFATAPDAANFTIIDSATAFMYEGATFLPSGGDFTYNGGETIHVELLFSQPVEFVNADGGTTNIELSDWDDPNPTYSPSVGIDLGALFGREAQPDRPARLNLEKSFGSTTVGTQSNQRSTTKLVFSYQVKRIGEAGFEYESSNRGVALTAGMSADGLNLQRVGATSSNERDLEDTYPLSVARNRNLVVDGDTRDPELIEVTLSKPRGEDGWYQVEDRISVFFIFNKLVRVRSSGGPQLDVVIRQENGVHNVETISVLTNQISGRQQFRTAVALAATDTAERRYFDDDGLEVRNFQDPGGTTSRRFADPFNREADMSQASELIRQAMLRIRPNERRVDTIHPKVLSNVFNRPNRRNTFDTSIQEKITLTVTFDEPMVVRGSPSISIPIGSNKRALHYDAAATMAANGGSDPGENAVETVVFSYAVGSLRTPDPDNMGQFLNDDEDLNGIELTSGTVATIGPNDRLSDRAGNVVRSGLDNLDTINPVVNSGDPPADAPTSAITTQVSTSYVFDLSQADAPPTELTRENPRRVRFSVDHGRVAEGDTLAIDVEVYPPVGASEDALTIPLEVVTITTLVDDPNTAVNESTLDIVNAVSGTHFNVPLEVTVPANSAVGTVSLSALDVAGDAETEAVYLQLRIVHREVNVLFPPLVEHGLPTSDQISRVGASTDVVAEVNCEATTCRGDTLQVMFSGTPGTNYEKYHHTTTIAIEDDDEQQVELSFVPAEASGTEQDESVQMFNVMATISGGDTTLDRGFRVPLEFGPGTTAIVDEDFTLSQPLSDGVEFATGATGAALSQQLTITVVDDDDKDPGDRVAYVTFGDLSELSGVTTSATAGSFKFKIADDEKDETRSVSFGAPSYSVLEGAPSVTVTVNVYPGVAMDDPVTSEDEEEDPLVIPVRVSEHSTAPTDRYGTVPSSVTITAGNSSAELVVPIDVGNETDEDVERQALVLRFGDLVTPGLAAGGNRTTTIYIEDDDLPAVTLSIDPTSVTRSEDDATAFTFAVVATVAGSPNGTIERGFNVPLRLHTDSTATRVADYTITKTANSVPTPVDLATEFAFWPADRGDQLRKEHVTITMVNDGTREGNETVVIELTPHAILAAAGQTAPAGVTIDPTANTLTVTIADDEPAVPPEAVDSLMAAAADATSVTLSWTAPEAHGSTITGYNIQRTETNPDESGATPTWTSLTASTGDSTTYTDTGLTEGTTYYYQVAAITDGGTAGWSNTASATPRGGTLVLLETTFLADDDGDTTYSEGDHFDTVLIFSHSIVLNDTDGDDSVVDSDVDFDGPLMTLGLDFGALYGGTSSTRPNVELDEMETFGQEITTLPTPPVDRLVFRYTVGRADGSNGGVAVRSRRAAFPGNNTRIERQGDNTQTLGGGFNTGGVVRDPAYVIDGVPGAPTLTSVTLLPSPTTGPYLLTERIQVALLFSEPVGVDSGSLTADFEVGDSDAVAGDVSFSGEGTDTLLLSYTVFTGDEDTDGIVVDNIRFVNTGANIVDANNNPVADTNQMTTASLTGANVDGIAPDVVSAVFNTPVRRNTFDITVNERIELTVTFDQAVSVTGTPTIGTTETLDGSISSPFSTPGGQRILTYDAALSGATTAVFTYEVQPSDQDDAGRAAPMAFGGTQGVPAGFFDLSGNAPAAGTPIPGLRTPIAVTGISPPAYAPILGATNTALPWVHPLDKLDVEFSSTNYTVAENGSVDIQVTVTGDMYGPLATHMFQGDGPLHVPLTLTAPPEAAGRYVMPDPLVAIVPRPVADPVASNNPRHLTSAVGTLRLTGMDNSTTDQPVDLVFGIGALADTYLNAVASGTLNTTVSLTDPVVLATLEFDATTPYSFTSTPRTGGYVKDDVITVQVMLNQSAVIAETTAGAAGTGPWELELELDFGADRFPTSANVANTGVARRVVAMSDLNTNASRTFDFAYTVQEGDVTLPVSGDEGIYIAANKLTVPPGLEFRADGNASLKLDVSTAPALPMRDTAHTVADNTDPMLIPPLTISNPADGDWFKLGDHIDVTATFSEAVEETSGTGSVNLYVGDCGGFCNKSPEVTSGEGSTQLVFRYTVVDGDFDDDGVNILQDDLFGTYRDAAGNSATLQATDSEVAAAGNRKVDGTLPTVMGSPSFTSNPVDTVGKIYLPPEEIQLTVTFSENVTLEGDFTHSELRVPFLLGDSEEDLTYDRQASTIKTALAAEGGNPAQPAAAGNTLVFSYEVEEGDYDGDGIGLRAADDLVIPAGVTIEDRAGNVLASGALATVPESTDHLVGTPPVRLPVMVMAWPPTVTEGGGTVDVVVTASVVDAVEDSDLTIELDAGTGSAMLTDDYTIVGSSLPATITIPVGETSGRAVVRLTLPLGDDNEPEEMIVLTGTSSGNGDYVNPDDLIITIATTQPAPGKTRYTSKELVPAAHTADPTTGWDDPGTAFPGGFLSSTGFRAGTQDNAFQSISSRTDGTEVVVKFDSALPADIVDFLVLRFTDSASGTTHDLRFKEVAYADETTMHSYTWNTTDISGLTLPVLTAATWWQVELMHMEPLWLNYADGASTVTEGETVTVTINIDPPAPPEERFRRFVVAVDLLAGTSYDDFGEPVPVIVVTGTPTENLTPAAAVARAEPFNVPAPSGPRHWIVTAAAGATSASISFSIDDDDLFEHGEGFEVRFAAEGAQLHAQWWPPLFHPDPSEGATTVAAVTITESKNAPTVALTSTQNALTERGGHTSTTLSYTLTPAASDAGTLPTDYDVVLTGFAGSAARNTGTNAATGDYSIAIGGAVVDGGTDVSLDIVDTAGGTAAPTAVLSIRDDGADDDADENITFTAEVQTGDGTTVSGITIATAEAITIVEALTVSWQEVDAAGEQDEPASAASAHTIGMTLNAPPVADVIVNLEVHTDTSLTTATAALDYSALGTPFVTFPMNATGADLTQTGSVNVAADDLVEIAETLRLTMVEGTDFPAGAVLDDGDGYTLTINDTDTLEIELGAPMPGSTVFEDVGTVTFPVTLNAETTVALEVDWEITLADPLTSGDLTPATGTVPIAAGSNADSDLSLTVTITDDTVSPKEAVEMFTVMLSEPTGPSDADSGLDDRAALGTTASQDVTIVADNDPIELNFAEGTYSGDEGTMVTVTINLTRDPALTADEVAAGASFVLVVAPGGGATVADFTAGAGLAVAADGVDNGYVITPAAGDATVEVTVELAADGDAETGNTVDFSFGASTHASWSARAFTAGTTQATASLAINENVSLPLAPTGVTATASTQSIAVSWTAPATGADPTSYDLQRSSEPSATRNESHWEDFGPEDGMGVVTTVNVTSGTSYTDAGNHLRAGTTYAYRVRARTADGSGPWSDSPSGDVSFAAVNPSAPASAPTLTPGYTQITVSWDAPTLDGGQNITAYVVQSSPDGMDDTWTNLETTADGSTTSFMHTGLGDEDTVHYRVAALNGVDDANPNFSPAVSGSPTPRLVLNFAPGSIEATLAENGGRQTITVFRGADTVGRLFFPLRRTFTGGASAGDFGNIADDSDVEVRDASDGDGVFNLEIAGQNVTFDVVAVDDDNWDPGEGVTYELDDDHPNWPAAFRAGERNILTVMVTDDEDAPTVTLSVSPVALAEAGGANMTTVSATVDFSGTSGFFQTAHTLALSFTGGDAGAGDFSSSRTTITLPAGDTQPTEEVVLTVTDDDTEEGQETIGITGAVQGTGGMVVIPPEDVVAPTTAPTIVDALTATVSFDTATSVAEPSTGHAFTVRLSATPTAEFPLTLAVSGVADADYENLSGTMFTFSANTATITQTGTIDIADDDVAEADETLTLTLSSLNTPMGAVIGDPASITVTDTDTVTASIQSVSTQVVEGESFVFEIVLSGDVGVPVTVPYIITGTGIVAEDFQGTAPLTGEVEFLMSTDAASRTREVSLAVLDDSTPDAGEQFTITLQDPTGALGGRATVDGTNNAITSTITEPDRTPPAVEIRAPARVNDVGTFTVTFEFNEDVQAVEFTSADITVSNGTDGAQSIAEPVADPLTQSRIFTAAITPATTWADNDSLTITVIDVPDVAGNDVASTEIMITFDTAEPMVQIDAPSRVNGAGTFTVTFTFSEDVQAAEFTVADIVVTNGTDAVTAGAPTADPSGQRLIFTSEITPDTTNWANNDEVIVTVSGVPDDAGNEITSTAATITFDTAAPVPTLTTDAATITGPFDLTITFLEKVTGLTADDVVITNGTKGAFAETSTGNDPSVFTLRIVPGSGPTLTANIAANAAMDLAGNQSTAAAEFSAPVVLARPTATITTDVGNEVEGVRYINAATFDITVTFSEDVENFDDAATDIEVDNGVAGTIMMDSASAYTATITPTAGYEGVVIITVRQDAATATAAPNAGNSVGELRVTIDRTGTTGDIVPDPNRPVNADFSITITFADAVTDFDVTDIELSGQFAGADVTNFTEVSATEYTADVTAPTDDGTLTLTIAADAVQDLAGNDLTAAVTEDVVVDRAAPDTVTFDPATDGRVNGDIDLTIDFGEAVSGLDEMDVVVTGTANASIESGTFDDTAADSANGRYAMTIDVPDTAADGTTIIVTLAADVASDLATNTGPSTEVSATYTVDRTAPTPTFHPETPGGASGDFTLTVRFGETVTGFDATDVELTSPPAGVEATTADFMATANAGEYTIPIVVPSTVTEGATITVTIAAGAGTDLAGNSSTGPATATYTVDRTAPTASAMIDSAASQPVTEAFDVDVTFTEPVRNNITGDANLGTSTLSADSFTVERGAITGIAGPQTGNIYTVTINPTANGLLTMELNADGVTDLAGNASVMSDGLFSVQSQAGDQLTVMIDRGAESNVADTFTVTFTFNRAINASTFTASDIMLGGAATATAGDPATTNMPPANMNRVFTSLITVSTEGEVTVGLPADAVRDDDNVPNQASNPATVSVTADPTAPVITFEYDDGTVVMNDDEVSGSFELTVNFDDNVGTSFALTDVVVSGDGEATNLQQVTAGESYTLDIAPPSTDGAFTITIAENNVMNVPGTGNALFVRTLNRDTVKPVVDLSDAPSHANADFNFTITITEGPLTAFTDANISLTGVAGATHALTEDTPGTEYTLAITLPATPTDLDAALNIAVAAGQVMDAAGNTNDSASTTVRLDRVAPTIASMNRAETGNITGIFTLTVTFSEEVEGFDRDDLTVVNGSAAAPTQTSAAGEASVFTVVITPTGDTPLTVDIAADRVTDLAGNGNTAATQFTAPVALTVPIATVAAASGVGNVVSGETYINTETFEVTVSFTEMVSGFDAATDISVTGGTAGVPASVAAPAEDVNRVFTVVITPDADGEVNVQVPVNVANAVGGTQEANPASSPADFTVDRAAPEVESISVPDPARVNAAFEVTVTFDEPVTGFEMADLDVTNGAASNFAAVALMPAQMGTAGSYSTVFTATVTPTADFVGNVTITIAEDVAQDRATNNNTALAAPVSVAADLEAPTVEGITSDAATTVTGVFDVTVTFSEPVNEFTSDDLELDNASAGEPVAASDRESFTVTLTPTMDGDVEVQVKVDAVADDFGNRGPAAISPATAFSRTAALPTIPGKPTDLRATGGRNTINLRWNAPADGGSEITGYRIQVSPNGSTDWAPVVPQPTGTDTRYAHAGLDDGLTRHYRVYASNAVGESTDPSDSAMATTFAPIPITAETPRAQMVRMMVDTNNDGRITSVDASALLFQVTGEGDADADPEVRRTLFGPLLPANVDRDNTGAVDAAIDKVVAEIEATLKANEEALDINGDGETDENDAEIIHNVTAFPELVGDGQPGTGFRVYRQVLIGRFMAGGNPSDAEMRAVIRAVRGL